MGTKQRWIMHVDMDAFFASVEQLDHPEYRGKPVIVGGLSGRGVVSTCSYEARKFGVHSAMPMTQAWQLCPKAIFVTGRYDRYTELSQQIQAIFREFSPAVEPLSIDEAFLDLTGMDKLVGRRDRKTLLLPTRFCSGAHRQTVSPVAHRAHRFCGAGPQQIPGQAGQ